MFFHHLLLRATFSYMTQIKTKLRTQLTDVHLKDQLRLRTTILEPNIELLVKNKQYQKSHYNYILNLVFY